MPFDVLELPQVAGRYQVTQDLIHHLDVGIYKRQYLQHLLDSKSSMRKQVASSKEGTRVTSVQLNPPAV
jgi:hypothetical protein